MKYLLLQDVFNRQKYIELKDNQEEKIENLIQTGKIPKHFILNGEEVISDNIIGFTNDKPEDPKPELGIRSMDDLRKWAETQKWYRKKPTPEFSTSYQAEPSSLLP